MSEARELLDMADELELADIISQLEGAVRRERAAQRAHEARVPRAESEPWRGDVQVGRACYHARVVASLEVELEFVRGRAARAVNDMPRGARATAGCGERVGRGPCGRGYVVYDTSGLSWGSWW